jgi:hypothetical protein
MRRCTLYVKVNGEDVPIVRCLVADDYGVLAAPESDPTNFVRIATLPTEVQRLLMMKAAS